MAGKDYSVAMESPIEIENKGKLIHTLAAAKLIKDLESGRSSYHDNAGNLKEEFSSIDKEYSKAKIIELAMRYQLVTKFTSFVIVDDRNGRVTERAMIFA